MKTKNKSFKELDKIFKMSSILKKLYQRELSLVEGSATRNWLEKHKPNHPLLTSLSKK